MQKEGTGDGAEGIRNGDGDSWGSMRPHGGQLLRLRPPSEAVMRHDEQETWCSTGYSMIPLSVYSVNYSIFEALQKIDFV